MPWGTIQARLLLYELQTPSRQGSRCGRRTVQKHNSTCQQGVEAHRDSWLTFRGLLAPIGGSKGLGQLVETAGPPSEHCLHSLVAASLTIKYWLSTQMLLLSNPAWTASQCLLFTLQCTIYRIEYIFSTAQHSTKCSYVPVALLN